MLILLLDGLWAGVKSQATIYTSQSGADLYVFQPGVRDLTAGASSLPLQTVDAISVDPGVLWAAPVKTANVVLALHGRKVAVYLVGSVPGAAGGAWAISSGRAPLGNDEIVVGTTLAKRHGLGIDDTVDVLGRPFRVVGLAKGSGYMFAYVFVTHAAIEQMSGSPGTTSVVLVGVNDVSEAGERLRSRGFNALSASEVGANDLEFAVGVFGSPVRLMVGIAFGISILIIALTGYTTVVERERDYAVAKALGATSWHLARVALSQTLALTMSGLLAGGALFLVGRRLIEAARPQFAIVLTLGGVVRSAVAAIAMAAVAAGLPARRLATLEPAAAFRRTV